MEVARRLVWRCLVDDPVLFFRTILEQFTKKDKQVCLNCLKLESTFKDTKSKLEQ